METNFDKIKSLLKNSSVSDFDQQDFLKSCEGVVDHNLELLVHLFTEHSEWIERTVEDYKRKKQVIIEKDMRVWKTIVAEEVQELRDMKNLRLLRNKGIGA